MVHLSIDVTQAEFGKLVGVSQQAVSQYIKEGIMTADGNCAVWLHEYCSHLRETAAGRVASGDLDLANERAQLARAQRIGQEIKNDVASGSYAPIELLSDVLSNASQAVVDRLDQIPAALRRVCPDLPQAVRDAVMSEIASARNEMIRKTASIVADQLEHSDIQDEEDALTEADSL